MLWRCNGALLAFLSRAVWGQGEDLPAHSRALGTLQPAAMEKCASESLWELGFGFSTVH